MSLTDVIVSFFDRRGDEYYTEPELAEFILESQWLNDERAKVLEAFADRMTGWSYGDWQGELVFDGLRDLTIEKLRAQADTVRKGES